MATVYNKTTGQIMNTGGETSSNTGLTGFNKATGQTGTVNNSTASAEKKKTPTVQEQLQAREKASQANIGTVYDANINAQRQSLLNAYNQNTTDQAKQREAINQIYQGAAYDIGVQNARNARNLNQFADVRAVNTGLGSQQALSLGNAAERANAVINFQREQALQEADRQKQMMTTTYQNQVAAAVADNDYKKAAALLDDYNNQKKWTDQQAQILASYGNFDPYKTLYGDDAAKAMQKVWQAQNPEVAYRTGAIDAETYKKITGKYPEGYEPEGGGGWEAWDTWWIPNPSSGPGNGGNGGSIGSPGGGGGGSSTPYTLISSTFPWRN